MFLTILDCDWPIHFLFKTYYIRFSICPPPLPIGLKHLKLTEVYFIFHPFHSSLFLWIIIL